MIAVLFLAGQPCAWAEETSTGPTKIIGSSRETVNYYNAFGLCYKSTETSTMTTTATDGDTENTTYSVTTTNSVWKDGSLKVDTITGTSTTKNTAKIITDTSNYTTTYIYDSLGRLQGASGVTTSFGTLPDNGGDYTATTTNTYTIKNGQALLSQSVTKQTVTVDGQVKPESTQTVNYSYQLLGGINHIVKETMTYSGSENNGGSTNMSSVKTYERNENGSIINITQTKTGTSISIDDSTGASYRSELIYSSHFTEDPAHGWYMDLESTNWELVSINGQPLDSYSESGAGEYLSAEDAVANSRASLAEAVGNSSNSGSSSGSGATAGTNGIIQTILDQNLEGSVAEQAHRLLEEYRAAHAESSAQNTAYIQSILDSAHTPSLIQQ